MGSKLPAQLQPFQFLVQAKRDPRSNPLERLQLIKGWIDRDGQKHNKVIDLEAEKQGDGLCAVYQDPDYDAGVPTYYYMRAVEVASPRWSAAQCAALPAGQRPANCKNDQLNQIYEMAWASPIWLTPNFRASLAAGLAEHGSAH